MSLSPSLIGKSPEHSLKPKSSQYRQHSHRQTKNAERCGPQPITTTFRCSFQCIRSRPIQHGSRCFTNRHVYARTIAVVVPVRVNYEIQDLARDYGNSSEAVALRWSAIRDR